MRCPAFSHAAKVTSLHTPRRHAREPELCVLLTEELRREPSVLCERPLAFWRECRLALSLLSAHRNVGREAARADDGPPLRGRRPARRRPRAGPLLAHTTA